MEETYIFEKVEFLKSKFRNLLKHSKQVKSLENYSAVAETFKHKDYLTLIKTCMGCSFLDEKDSEYLDHLVDKYRINFLDWAHKTPWLKKEMAMMALNKAKVEPLQLNIFTYKERETTTINVPVEVLGNKPKQISKRI